jgi:hypothetical protein
MTTTELARSRAYLANQRRAIIARSIAASLAGALPLPFLDDWAIGTILGRGYRRIAAAHQVDLDDEAVKLLVFGPQQPPSIVELAASGIALRTASRAARRMMVVITAFERARSAARTFTAMTLFDHYCARLHTGPALDAATAQALRDEIGRSIEGAPGSGARRRRAPTRDWHPEQSPQGPARRHRTSDALPTPVQLEIRA